MPILKHASGSNIGLLTAGGTLVGGYVALGIGFYWLMQPMVFKNLGMTAYKPPSATIVIYPETPFVPPTPSSSLPPPGVAVEPPVESAFAAAIPEVQEKPALAVPQHPKKRERTTYRRQERPTSSRPERPEHFGRNTWGSPYEFRSVW
jgi:hypothetical protein